MGNEVETGSDAGLAQAIEEAGWAVFQIAEGEFSPAYAFSVGLFKSFDHPEIIVFGLPYSMMLNVINNVGEKVRGGTKLEVGQTYPEIFAGYTCVFQPVAKAKYAEYLDFVSSFYGSDSFPALQCVWPDQLNRFPWEPEFDTALQYHQPLLNK